MKHTFRPHPQIVLGALTVIFVLLAGFSATWTVRTLVAALGTALRPPASQATIEKFDIEGAEILDLRGLVR